MILLGIDLMTWCIPLYLLIILACNFETSFAADCGFVVCGDGVVIEYPFWHDKYGLTQSSEEYCGYPGLGLSCNNYSQRKGAVLSISDDLYHVLNLSKKGLTIVHHDFLDRTCPRPLRNFTFDDSHSLFKYDPQYTNFTFFYNCTSAPLGEAPPTFDSFASSLADFSHLPCLDYNNTLRSYGLFNDQFPNSTNWYPTCEKSVVYPVTTTLLSERNADYIESLQYGLELMWETPIACKGCESSGGRCLYSPQTGTKSNFTCLCPFREEVSLDDNGEVCIQPYITGKILKDRNSSIKIIIICVSAGVGGLVVLLLLFFCRKNLASFPDSTKTVTNVDVFLESYGCLSLQKYKYSHIKRMTNSFKDKLGQGGYGSVFKGKLDDGRLVAVKVLINDPKKGNGEEFINEVATIGRTNHVNIVSLLGFCSSSSKRALVYEFMPNGSLERFIYVEKEPSNNITSTADANANQKLKWDTLYEIALGIARGLEYLHRGCTTRILHFDIKPHNILLDDNFCPKISDFGLAKLCPTRDSFVSMVGGGRGTIGYIAPEVYCRNIGGVSYKSDVYSYGMMVLEMVGGRKNIDPFVDKTSEIYFPHWIYNHLEVQEDSIHGLLRFEEVWEEEMARKMITVGLWCIQVNPRNRPSMSKVVEMLEGSVDLQKPPKPFTD